VETSLWSRDAKFTGGSEKREGKGAFIQRNARAYNHYKRGRSSSQNLPSVGKDSGGKKKRREAISGGVKKLASPRVEGMVLDRGEEDTEGCGQSFIGGG